MGAERPRIAAPGRRQPWHSGPRWQAPPKRRTLPKGVYAGGAASNGVNGGGATSDCSSWPETTVAFRAAMASAAQTAYTPEGSVRRRRGLERGKWGRSDLGLQLLAGDNRGIQGRDGKRRPNGVHSLRECTPAARPRTG